MATCAVQLRQVKVVKQTAGKARLTLASDLGDLIGLDVSDTVVQLTNCEIDEQERMGNQPTNLVINNRPGNLAQFGLVRRTSREQLVFKTQTLFGNAAEMVAAAREAYHMLVSLTRRKTGAAQGSYLIYLGTNNMVGQPGIYSGRGITGINRLEPRIRQNSMISIVGPNVIYGRKLYWNPSNERVVNKPFPGLRAAKAIGVRLYTGRTRRGNLATAKFAGTDQIHMQVKKKMRRKAKWKQFSFSDPFYPIFQSAMIGDRRVPAISIMMKSRGRI